ncbi:unnamed protein product [Haemonchus placei]|uniref:MOSC domain-containing protein n=1 Tax=Haemonchus placei TaxID=6290 RepID=A0A0N4W3W6_HAEPC|nr:unnamed protein product [Haemonchus placei]
MRLGSLRTLSVPLQDEPSWVTGNRVGSAVYEIVHGHNFGAYDITGRT